MRVAVVQFAPKIGRVQDNIETAQKLCDKLRPRSVDLVCLPEMIFTGYVFDDAVAISPYLEQPGTGPTSRFCAQLAARLHCHVAAGYPERLESPEIDLGNGASESKVGANSAVLYGPDGALIANYRKTNLFETDMTWAKAGSGFMTLNLPLPLKTVTLGICMDLNPQPPAQWTLLDGPYEIAEHCAAHNSHLLILLNAWLDSGDEPHEETDWQTINYWAARLRPLWAKVPKLSKKRRRSDDQEARDETYVVVCNRCGEESGKTFAGSSSLFSMNSGTGGRKLLAAMKRREEGVAVWTIPAEK